MTTDRAGEREEPAASGDGDGGGGGAADDEHHQQPLSVSDRRLVSIGLVIVLTTAAVGALLGRLLPAQVGTDTLSIVGITFVLSPAMMALYSGVAVATFLVTLLAVLQFVSQFDEG